MSFVKSKGWTGAAAPHPPPFQSCIFFPWKFWICPWRHIVQWPLDHCLFHNLQFRRYYGLCRLPSAWLYMVMVRSSARADNQLIIRLFWWLIVENSQSITKKKRKILLSSCTNSYKFVILATFCGSECSFTQNFPGAHISRVLHVLSLIRCTLHVHIGAIITSLYNTHVNRLLIEHRSAHTSDDRFWTSSQLPSLVSCISHMHILCSVT